jgi:uncharacterized protein YjbI with pentapeptide repeats
MEGVEERVRLVTTHDLLFGGEVNTTTRRRKSLFSNTLVLPGLNLYEALKITDPKQLGYKKHLFDLRGRHLERAVLDDAAFWSTDFTGAWLKGASLNSARLQGALLDHAQLQGARCDFSSLQEASLINAQLQGASLRSAQLQGAAQNDAQLQGSSLYAAKLQGASLQNANLQGASLELAQLQGGMFDNAQLQGASLDNANFPGTLFFGAQLQGAALASAVINAADLSHVFLWRTSWQNMGPANLGAIRLNEASWEPSRKKVLLTILSLDL